MNKRELLAQFELNVFASIKTLKQRSALNNDETICDEIRHHIKQICQSLTQKKNFLKDNNFFSEAFDILMKTGSAECCVDILYNKFIVKYYSFLVNFSETEAICNSYNFIKDYMTIMGFLTLTPDYSLREYDKCIEEFLLSFLGE